jgi:hypothetical protein
LDSPFNNALAHFLNLSCFLSGTGLYQSGNVKTVQAGLFKVNPDIENTDTACIKAVMDNNINLFFYLTHAAREIHGPEIIISASKGKVKWTMENIVIVTKKGERIIKLEDPVMLRKYIWQALFARLAGVPNAFVCGLSVAKMQTICVNGAHESSPIIQVPDRWLERVANNDSYVTALKGIEKVFNQAFNEERLMNKTDYPWVQIGNIVDMTAYSLFNGGRCKCDLS